MQWFAITQKTPACQYTVSSSCFARAITVLATLELLLTAAIAEAIVNHLDAKGYLYTLLIAEIVDSLVLLFITLYLKPAINPAIPL